jgi:SAM-dependent methyltransferase
MRHEVTKMFEKFLASQNLTVRKVAIIGGSSLDPEACLVKEIYPKALVHFFDIANPEEDEMFFFLDINKSETIHGFEATFDLVISSQVLEHIWNHSNFFSILERITREDGLIWLNCPKSNLEHGSPHYFSAGFTSSYLTKNLGSRNFAILDAGEIGNKRYYLATHLARYWQTPGENRRPIRSYNFQPGTKLGVLRKFLREFPVRVLLVLIPKPMSEDSAWATESYAAGRKNRS